jgi:hypothetical protein
MDEKYEGIRKNVQQGIIAAGIVPPEYEFPYIPDTLIDWTISILLTDWNTPGFKPEDVVKVYLLSPTYLRNYANNLAALCIFYRDVKAVDSVIENNFAFSCMF